MPRLKDILQEVTVSTQAGADYSRIQDALADSVDTLRIESEIVLTESVILPAGITLIIGSHGIITGAYTLTGNNTVLKAEGFNQIISVSTILAGSWIIPEVRPEWFAAAGDGVTDDNLPFQAAIRLAKISSGKQLTLRNTTYLVNGELRIEGLQIRGNHAMLTSDLGSLLKAMGSHGTYYALSGNVYKGDSWVKVSDATFLSSLSKGDVVKMMSDEIVQPAAMESVRMGEMHEVRSVDAVNGMVYFNDFVNWNYLTSNNSRIARVQLADVAIKDLKVWLTIEDTTAVAVNLQYCRAWVDNVRIKAFTYCCMLDNCWKPYFRGQTFQSDQDGYGYGVCASGATMYADISGVLIGARHCFTTGGSGSYFSPNYGGISWHTNVHDSIGTAGKLANSCFDTHASSGSIVFNNCIAVGGVYRDYVLTISDWDSVTTYPVDSLVRSITRRLYKALLENTNHDPDGDQVNWVATAGNNQSGFKAEGLYEKFVNCKTFGCNNGLQVYGVDVQEIIVENFDCNEVEYALLHRYDCTVQKLFVNGLRVNNDHIKGKALYLVGNVVEWSFSNIFCKNAMILQKSLNTTRPSTLVLNNASAEYTVPTNIPAIGLYDQDVKVVMLNNVNVKNCHLFQSINDNGRTATRLISIQGGSVSGSVNDVIYLDHPVENLVVNGLQVYDPTDPLKYLIYIRRALTRLSLSNVSYFGSNALLAIYTYSAATLGYILHNNNIMPNLTTFRTGTGANAAIEIVGGGFGAGVVYRGTGTPEGAVTAPIGTMYLRNNGGAGTTLYIKESGTGNTGWIAK